ncbi:MAG: hypothetical protein COA79_09955 [Planctomycetota bacterium]|nr:MAG: hypothetical protein COA79_09955 [Planctomycetota bacterium]
MRKICLICLFSCISFMFLCGQNKKLAISGLRVSNENRNLNYKRARNVMAVISQLLLYYHYRGNKIDDEVSEKAFNKFIKILDFNKNIFLKEDIEKLSKFEQEIDTEFKNGFSRLSKVSLNIKQTRNLEVQAIYKKLLSVPLDLKKEITLISDFDLLEFPVDNLERVKRWQNLLHQFFISTYVGMLVEKENKLIKKESTDKDQKKATEKKINYLALKIKPLDKELEKKAREKILKGLNMRFKRIADGGELDHFNLYINAVCSIFGPHTAYHMPTEKEDIDIDLTGQLEGIGAQLQEDGDTLKVVKIIPGSASSRQKELKEDDLIIKVAQGNGEPVDLTGMGIREAVRLIRGKKGTEVRLTVKKPSGLIKVIPIIRDVVILENSYARSMVVEDKQSGKKIGYLLLPGFYWKKENSDLGRSSSEDIKRELLALKKQNVDGIVFDLRNNGGGSLSDVVNMVGHFIPKGPVVQVRSPSNRKKPRNILSDLVGGVIYAGPLVVMINKVSASASEIFAAAIQDYGRGVILGSGRSSFGKGTVQTFFGLQRGTNEKDVNIGALRITIQKFYRINGQTTQFNGVVPDVVMPTQYMELETGEKYKDNALKSDIYLPTSYEKYAPSGSFEVVIKSSQARVDKSEYFSNVLGYAKFLKQRRGMKKTKVSYNQQLEDLDLLQKKAEELKKISKEKRTLIVTPIVSQKGNEAVKESLKETFKKMEIGLKEDLYFHEAINLIDEISNKLLKK